MKQTKIDVISRKNRKSTSSSREGAVILKTHCGRREEERVNISGGDDVDWSYAEKG